MSAAFERAVTALRLLSANARHPVTPLTADELLPLSDMAPGIGEMYRAQVRAVLGAVREPDAAMLNAAMSEPVTEHVDSLIAIAYGHGARLRTEYSGNNTPIKRWWRAMIDEVLRNV